MAKKTVNKRKKLYICVSVLLCIYAISMLLPCWYLLINSFKSIDDYTSKMNFWGFPEKFEFGNYMQAFTYEVGAEKATIPLLYLNSIVFTIVSVLLATVAVVVVSYACARFEFRGKGLIVALGIGALVFPDFGSTSVIYRLFTNLGWLGTWWVLLPKGSQF